MNRSPRRRKPPVRWWHRLGVPRTRDGWIATGLFAAWVGVIFLIAIDPYVEPHVPGGRGWWLAAVFNSWRLVHGGPWEWLLLVYFWLPTGALLWVIVPGIMRSPAEERRRAVRRERDRARRAERRAAAAKPPT